MNGMSLRAAQATHDLGTHFMAMPPALTQRRPAPGVAQAEAEGTLVLVADDHPLTRMLIVRLLNLLGYAAEASEDGALALEKWKSGRFGLVLTDCEMPVMDGYALARSIRELEAASAARRTPVLAFTAHALEAVTQKCNASGIDACMVKPLGAAGLGEALDRWLPVPVEPVPDLSSG